jgi:predicted nucleic acid-binding protein
MRLFFDTSALTKVFHKEIGTNYVIQLINDSENQVCISELTIIEFLNAMYRLYRDSYISNEELISAINGFDKECNRFNTVALNLAIVNGSRELLARYGKRFPLRSLDSIQIASYNLVCENDRDWAFVTSDIKLIRILQDIGIEVINPKE